MAKPTIYTVGGTVQAGGGIYIKRKADDELLELCRQGEFAFILSSRQVGKSSLMVRTAQQLEKENIHTVTIDLSAIGVKVSQDEWYLGILNEIASTLNLETDIFAWWNQYAQLGPAQRLSNFFKDVLLKEVNEQVVLFFDEIDSTLSIPFSDDFYVALRAVYNARSTNPEFKRLSFVLVGVAAPSDLISDNKRTPFNIGRRVEINDFTLAEALPLADGLGEEAVQVLTWAFQYTGGHPYLTQRLCAYLANSKEALNEQAVAIAVDRLFTGEQGKQDNNLQFVRDMLSERSPDVTRVLKIYKDIRSGKPVVDDERSITKAHLKLSGLVRSEKGILKVRNEIYNTVFNLNWVQENTPKNWQRIALISVSAILGFLILGTLAVFVNDYFVGSRRDQHFRSFISASSPEQRLTDLAEIYKREGILSNKDSDLTASQLFYGLSTAEDQLALFRIYDIHDNPILQKDLVVVISHLHTTVANVDPEVDNTRLLQAMRDALHNVKNDPVAAGIENELTAWIAARESFDRKDYIQASANYTAALSSNPGNHALLYERAKVYVALKLYTNALKDLDATIGAAKESAPNIPTPLPTALQTDTVVPTQPTSIPNTREIQTAVQTNQTSPPTSEIISGPTEINTTPKGVITPTREPTFTPISTPTLTPVPTYILPPKYKSNFTTLIDVVTAVQTMIENTPELQIAAQSKGQTEYSVLQSYSLIPTVSPLQSSNAQSTSLATASPASSSGTQSTCLVAPSVVQSSDTQSQTQSLPTIASVSNRASGIEVSYWNAEIDWAKVKNEGIDFAFVKATEGDFYYDPTFDDNWIGTKSVGIPRGAKHFFRANVDPVKQAECFIAAVQVMGDLGELPPLLDLETIDGKLSEDIIPSVKIWLDLVEKAFGKKPIIYSGQFFLQDNFSEAGGNPPAWAQVYPLFIASYPSTYVEESQPPLPRGWATWLFWEYTEKGTIDGVNSNAEMSVFNGSVEDLQAYIATVNNVTNQQLSTTIPGLTQASTAGPTSKSWSSVSAEIPADFPSPFIRLRNYPDLNSTVMGSVEPGDQVLVTAYTINGWIWYQLDVPTRGIEGAWISGVIELGGKNYASVVSSTDIPSNSPFILLKDIVKP